MVKQSAKYVRGVLLTGIGLLALGGMTTASAHFQMMVPSNDMVKQDQARAINLDVMFWHPYEGFGMDMNKPVQFGVLIQGQKTSLLDTLKPAKMKDLRGDAHDAYTLNYTLKKPGDHIFYLEPAPYWEPAEESYIVHYTKVVVNAFGMEEGWDQEVGLKTEIVPLTRPYGLYAGNVFQGIVKVNGKPVPYSTVEVEYYNKDGALKPKADPMITQVIKADANGVFTYAMPKSGWWAFAALNEDDKPMVREGKEYPVEIGAVLLIKTYDMK